MIDLTFRNINRWFVLLFKNGGNDHERRFSNKYYMSIVEIKDFSALIDKKNNFLSTHKSKQGAYENLH